MVSQIQSVLIVCAYNENKLLIGLGFSKPKNLVETWTSILEPMAEASKSKEEIVNESDDAEHLCASCKRLDKQTTATLFCTTCNEFQCDSCGNAHKLFPVTSEHVRLDASDEKAGLPGYDMKGMDRCENIRNESNITAKRMTNCAAVRVQSAVI